MEKEDIGVAVNFLLGSPLPRWDHRKLDVSWATLSMVLKRLSGVDDSVFLEAFHETGDVGDAAELILRKAGIKRQSSLVRRELTLSLIKQSFEAIAESSGYKSRERKERLLESLFGFAEPKEINYLIKIMIGEMRIGFNEGLMELAVSQAFHINPKAVRRALMLVGDLGKVAKIAKTEGTKGIDSLTFRFFRPIKPMLAQHGESISEVLKEHNGKTALEFKLDGARIQIHKLKDQVRIYSRRLTDVTNSLPEIVDLVKERINADVVLEGEVIAVGRNGKPLPFQHLMKRFRRLHNVKELIMSVPIELFLFDILYLNGKLMVDLPYIERRKILSEICGGIQLTPQIIAEDEVAIESFLEKAINEGHEGLMAKRLDSLYEPGSRGKNWIKIKKTLEPLDLVIVAAEYGYGRRHRWLSDYYLAAREENTGRLLVVGKTFKGLTDEEIIELTKRLKDLAIITEGRKVVVKPEIVVEVLYNEIQKSPKYDSGVSLRFARVSRIRYDKKVEDIDTIGRVLKIYEEQFGKKSRFNGDDSGFS